MLMDSQDEKNRLEVEKLKLEIKSLNTGWDRILKSSPLLISIITAGVTLFILFRSNFFEVANKEYHAETIFLQMKRDSIEHEIVVSKRKSDSLNKEVILSKQKEDSLRKINIMLDQQNKVFKNQNYILQGNITDAKTQIILLNKKISDQKNKINSLNGVVTEFLKSRSNFNKGFSQVVGHLKDSLIGYQERLTKLNIDKKYLFKIIQDHNYHINLDSLKHTMDH